MNLGIVAGFVSLLAFFPYANSILKGKTKPNRASWWIWAWVSILILFSYKASGANHTIWISVVYVITPLITAILSIKYGVGGWTKFDLFCLGGSLAVSVYWFFSRSAVTALYLFLIIDLFGTLPTLKKTYFFPEQENKLSWTIMVIANILNIFAAEEMKFSIIVYPLYMVACGGAILALTLRRANPKMI